MKNKKVFLGNIIIEVLFAVGVLSLCLVAMVSAIVSATKTSRFSHNNALANKYAQEGLEIVRINRDSRGWREFRTVFSGNMGLALGANEPSGSCPGTPNIDSYFTRCINFNHIDDDRSIITSRVAWDEASRPHRVEMITELTKWSHQ